jgi:hypothetical protein
METEWEERFKAVVKCVYCVLWDVDDKMTEIKEHILATGKLNPFLFETWPTAKSAGDAKAYMLDTITTRLCDMTNEIINTDYEPTVERSSVPAVLEKIKQCIEEMRAHVVNVEEVYNVDCMVLKTSMETAVSQLETYIVKEK